MRAIIIIIFAILCAGTCKAQILELTPANGKMLLKLDFAYREISTSNKEFKRGKLTWGDGSEIRIDLNNQSKSRFNRVVRKMEQHPYTWLHTNDRIYKYKN